MRLAGREPAIAARSASSALGAKKIPMLRMARNIATHNTATLIHRGTRLPRPTLCRTAKTAMPMRGAAKRRIAGRRLTSPWTCTMLTEVVEQSVRVAPSGERLVVQPLMVPRGAKRATPRAAKPSAPAATPQIASMRRDHAISIVPFLAVRQSPWL
jgi:hypothetical protein